MTTPTLELKGLTEQVLEETLFYHSTDGQQANVATRVSLVATESGILVNFTCEQAYYHELNTYTLDNTDLWRQEVFEVFIAAGEEIPVRYLELEINPNNAFFAAWVTNETGSKPDSLDMIDTSIFENKVAKEADTWGGTFLIPYSVIGKSEVYRINFYRITLHTRPETEEWECSPENCYFLCWNSTESGENPAFHRPAFFGTLRLNP